MCLNLKPHISACMELIPAARAYPKATKCFLAFNYQRHICSRFSTHGKCRAQLRDMADPHLSSRLVRVILPGCACDAAA